MLLNKYEKRFESASDMGEFTMLCKAPPFVKKEKLVKLYYEQCRVVCRTDHRER